MENSTEHNAGLPVAAQTDSRLFHLKNAKPLVAQGSKGQKNFVFV